MQNRKDGIASITLKLIPFYIIAKVLIDCIVRANLIICYVSISFKNKILFVIFYIFWTIFS